MDGFSSFFFIHIFKVDRDAALYLMGCWCQKTRRNRRIEHRKSQGPSPRPRDKNGPKAMSANSQLSLSRFT